MNEEIIEKSMAIILNAGDARLHIKQALDCIELFDFDEAKKNLNLAQEKINVAHRVQTEAISGESRGEEAVYSILLTHAQDTLMTVYSELHLARKMISIFAKVDERIKKLEVNND